MWDHLRILLDAQQRRRFMFVLAGMLLAAVLEMLGIGAIPGFVALLTRPLNLPEVIPVGFIADWVRAADPALVILAGAAVLAAIFVVKNIYIAGLIYFEGLVTRDVVASVATRLFRAYLLSPYTFHLQRNPAELTRNVSAEVLQAVALVSSAMIVAREGLVLIVVFLLLLLLDPLISLTTFLILGTAAAAFYALVRRSLSRRGRLAQTHRGLQLRAISQGLGAIKVAKVLGREAHLTGIFGAEARAIQEHGFYQKVVGAMPRLFLEVLGVLAIVLVAAVFALLGRGVETMLPVLALLAVGTVRLVPAFNAIAASLTQIRYQHPSLALVCDELRTLEREEAAHSASSGEVDRLRERICLTDVTFRYPDSSVDSLRSVSLAIEAGTTAGIIGASGAGKSTLIDIVLGLLVPTQGTVQVDGRDVFDGLRAWQSQIGYIPQDIFLTDDSIRRNVAFGLVDDEIDDDALVRAIDTAQLAEFVSTLPAGLDTVVGDRGVRLSGGQRQRIGIARALYHNPSVLVMDEATSALDNETEREVVRALGRLRGDHTIIIIAHRLTTVEGCDRLYLLHEGQVQDEGSFEELAERHEHLRASPALRPNALL